MTSNSKPIPDGFRTVTTSLTFRDSNKALEFYQRAFGAVVIDHLPNPVGNGTMHATMKIGDTIVMMGDENPSVDCGKSAETLGGSPISMFVYVDDVDTEFKKAVDAGGSVTMPVMEMFWGDRCGAFKDPFGYTWMIATRVKDLTQSQVQEAAKAFFQQTAKQQG